MNLICEKLYSPQGEAEARVILLHGFLGDHRDWRAFSKEFVKFRSSFEVLAYDLPGHGLSKDILPQNWEQLIQSIAADLRSLRGLPTYGVGYSMGGRVLAGLAATDEQLFHKVFFISSHFGLGSDKERLERLNRDCSLLAKVLSGSLSFKHFLDNWYELDLFQGIKSLESYNDILTRRLEQNVVQVDYSLKRCLSVGLMPNCESALEKQKSKNFYFYGESDRKYRSYAQDHARFLSLHLCPEVSHNIVAAEPHWLAKNISALII